MFEVRARAANLCRGVAKLVKASDFDSDMRGFESFFPCQIFSLTPRMRPCSLDGVTVLFNTVLFTGNANPALAQEIATHLGVELGKAKVGRFSDGEVDVEIQQNVRARDVFVVQPTCAPTNENLMELLHHGRCAQARLGAPHHRGDPVLRLRPPGPPPALDARADQRQGRRQPARGRRRRAAADDGPARRPDPGLLRHPGRQHLRLAGAAVRPAEQALRRPRGRLARRRRRGARPRAGQAARLRPGDHRQAPRRRPTSRK